ncbi:hypothetical protein UFOVP580_46 [uncultured Caudovirales phage]|uniref:Uncharacterized protein n=1 Tax=uncultured Caudovirales phage TaxID=2100421 RepID=A0A6J5PHZ0_9CAUD|nr:hypothetical protein UFOVP580_46 [uncultured Caudovirales phage]
MKKYFYLPFSLLVFILVILILVPVLPFDVYRVYQMIPSVKSRRTRTWTACKVTWTAFTGAVASGWKTICEEWK